MSRRIARIYYRQFFHQDSSSSDDDVIDYAFDCSGFDRGRFYQRKIEKMKRLRDKYDWEVEEERRRLLDRLYPLTDDFQGHYPDFRSVFQPDQIHQLVMDSIYSWPDDPRIDFKAFRFFEFVRRTGFVDEPKVDREGEPITLSITPIHIVARRRVPRESSGMDALFAIYNSYDANCTDESGFTHFHAACVYGLASVVKKFLDSGLPRVDANLVWPKTGDSPLNLALGSWAPWRDQPGDRWGEATFRTLLEAGADPNLANARGETALHIICQRHYNIMEVAAKMLFEKCDERYRPLQVDTQDSLGNTPLLLAVNRDDLKMIELLLKTEPPRMWPTTRVGHRCTGPPRNCRTPRLFIVIESLEDKDYELDRSQATSVMRFFSRYGLFARSEEIPPRAHPFKWYFEARSKEIKVKPALSLHELIQLSPREAEKLVAYEDYHEFARRCKLSRLKFMEDREACARYLCEKMSTRFFRRWALHPFWELIHRRLPLEVCEMILAGLANEDLYSICLAAADPRQANLQ
ncbi:unnamed protein product [Trichogramma brassicae]|uniref:Uncharacterized protein n=1 Tax=Trichogramma brassicae TaxID=86971 RepID=A0A6H5IM52_9HYME|nr:unnamed protein product [Trichogramma brassicae]